MKYIQKGNQDLQPGYTTYVLQYSNPDEISFFAYTGETATNADKNGLAINDSLVKYFCKKGFSKASLIAPDIIVPNKECTCFTFREDTSDLQREEVFAKLIDCFVQTSKNEDLHSEKNLFDIQKGGISVAYTHAGQTTTQIDAVDIQERLRLKIPAVTARKRARRTSQKVY